MSKYNHTFTIAVPAEMREIANSVAAAMWVDIGDDKSFTQLTAVDALGQELAVCYAPCDDNFAASLPYLHAYPEQLHATVAMVLARDWPERQIPTLGEIEGFCAELKMAIATPYTAALQSFNLIPVEI